MTRLARAATLAAAAARVEQERLRTVALQRQADWERQAQQRVTERVAALFAGVSREVADYLREHGVPRRPSQRREFARLVEAHADELADAIAPDALDAGQHGVNRIVSELQRQGAGVAFDEVSEAVAETLRDHVFTASQRTMERVSGDVMGALERAYRDGLGIDDAAALISDDVFEGLQGYEAERIARTEINAAQQDAAVATERELGVEYHQWIAELDDRVRDEHADVHREIVRMDTPFSNGLRHPHDRTGPLESWINCRCRIRPFLIPEGQRAPHDGPFLEGDLVEAT